MHLASLYYALTSDYSFWLLGLTDALEEFSSWLLKQGKIGSNKRQNPVFILLHLGGPHHRGLRQIGLGNKGKRMLKTNEEGPGSIPVSVY